MRTTAAKEGDAAGREQRDVADTDQVLEKPDELAAGVDSNSKAARSVAPDVKHREARLGRARAGGDRHGRQVGRDRVRLEAMRRAPGLRNTGDEVANAKLIREDGWMMLGDVVDEGGLATGERGEGMYVGFFTFLRKV